MRRKRLIPPTRWSVFSRPDKRSASGSFAFVIARMLSRPPKNVEKFAGALPHPVCALPATYAQSPDVQLHASPHADQTFPGQITAAVKGQFVRFDNLVNKIINGFINVSSDVPSGNRHATENPNFLEFVDVHFFTRRRRLRFFAIISPSRTLSPILVTKTMTTLFKFRSRT